jgi:hypothetical protein
MYITVHCIFISGCVCNSLNIDSLHIYITSIVYMMGHCMIKNNHIGI